MRPLFFYLLQRKDKKPALKKAQFDNNTNKNIKGRIIVRLLSKPS